jgi:hypothetical protein
MFLAGHVWDRVYANVDALTAAKQTRVQQAVNTALHDIVTMANWPGYQSLLYTNTDAVFTPSDMARLLRVDVTSGLAGVGDGVDDTPTVVVDAQGVKDLRYRSRYRLTQYAHLQTGIHKVIPVTVDVADDSVTVTGLLEAHWELDPTLYGGWVQLPGEMNPRQMGSLAYDGLARRYQGPARSGLNAYMNPNRIAWYLFAPDSIAYNLAAADLVPNKKLRWEYIRFPEDVLSETQAIFLPMAGVLEDYASAMILRQDRRREDAQDYMGGFHQKLEEAKAAIMNHTLVSAEVPQTYFTNPLQYGPGTSLEGVFSPLS